MLRSLYNSTLGCPWFFTLHWAVLPTFMPQISIVCSNSFVAGCMNGSNTSLHHIWHTGKLRLTSEPYMHVSLHTVAELQTCTVRKAIFQNWFWTCNQLVLFYRSQIDRGIYNRGCAWTSLVGTSHILSVYAPPAHFKVQSMQLASTFIMQRASHGS